MGQEIVLRDRFQLRFLGLLSRDAKIQPRLKKTSQIGNRSRSPFLGREEAKITRSFF